jgi:hypothetical protein
MERQINRARKYVIVLIAVWIPSIFVNMYHTFLLDQRKDPYMMVELLVLLTSAQGILNSVVYIWGYRPFRWWIKEQLGLKHRALEPYEEADDTVSLLTTHAVLNDSSIRSVLKGSDQHTAFPEFGNKSSFGARIESGERAVRFGRKNDVRVIAIPEEYDDDSVDHEEDASRRGRESSQKSTGSWRGRLPSWIRRSSIG